MRRDKKAGFFRAEGELIAQVNSQRGEWWAYVLHMIPRLIRSLAEPGRTAPELRMQDFAQFAIGIARPLGYKQKTVIAAMRAAELEKLAFVAEQSPLPDALAQIATHQFRHLPYTPVSATQLLDELRAKIPSFPLRNAQHLGQRIRNELDAIQQRVDLTASKNEHTKTWWYRLGGRLPK